MYSLEINKKLKTYHLFLGVLITFLFAFLYAKLTDNPIDIETLERIKETSLSGPDNVKYREIQNLFMKERGWVFIIFGILTMTIFLQILLSQIKKQSSRSFMGFRYRVSERMENLLNEKLSFQERLKKEFKDLTSNDLLVAEMLHDGLSSKDIATELNITPASANTARYRIRKRMGLSTDTDLVEVLRNL